MKSPLTFIHKTSIIGFLLSMLVCFPLWHGFREFPCIPVFDIFENVLPIIGSIVLGVLLLSLVASLFIKNQKVFTPIILLSYFVLILFDVNRFRPEFYFFALVLLIVYLSETKKVNEADMFLMLRILVSAVYIFAGLNKLSDSFLPNLYEPIIRPLQQVLSKPFYKLFMSMSILVPLVEVFLGIGLWVPKLKNLTWKISIALHAAVLILLITHNFNYSVYAWNIAMVLLSYILCKKSIEGKVMDRVKQSTYLKIAVFQLVLIPSTHFVGLADSKVSFDVYSGKYAYTYVYLNPRMYTLLPEHLQKCSVRLDAEHDDYKLFIDIWAEREMKASIYHEDWALVKYKKYFEKYSESQPVKIVALKNNKEELIE
ncbi:MAG: hypothetical protein Q8M29_04305 [Bacteroidota bacterium]|nr:hypothetical protein [Bacteroidota bacterium]